MCGEAGGALATALPLLLLCFARRGNLMRAETSPCQGLPCTALLRCRSAMNHSSSIIDSRSSALRSILRSVLNDGVRPFHKVAPVNVNPRGFSHAHAELAVYL